MLLDFWSGIISDKIFAFFNRLPLPSFNRSRIDTTNNPTLAAYDFSVFVLGLFFAHPVKNPISKTAIIFSARFECMFCHKFNLLVNYLNSAAVSLVFSSWPNDGAGFLLLQPLRHQAMFFHRHFSPKHSLRLPIAVLQPCKPLFQPQHVMLPSLCYQEY